MITQPRFGAAPVKLSLDSSYYINWNNWYLRLNPDLKPIPFDSAIREIRSGAKNKYHETEIHGNRFLLPIKSDSTGSFSMEGIVSVDRNVIYKDEWLLLDILNNLKGRKICMQYSFRPPLEDVNKFLINENGLKVLDN
jgi:hypothetical protein